MKGRFLPEDFRFRTSATGVDDKAHGADDATKPAIAPVVSDIEENPEQENSCGREDPLVEKIKTFNSNESTYVAFSMCFL